MMAVSRKIAATSLFLLLGCAPIGHAEGFSSGGPNTVTRSVSGHYEFRQRGYHDARGNEHHGGHYGRSKGYRPDIVGGDGVPSYVRGLGTFAGDQAVARFPRNGIYYSAQAFASTTLLPQTINALAPKAKVIVVDPSFEVANPKSGCTMEHGVCVIRGAP